MLIKKTPIQMAGLEPALNDTAYKAAATTNLATPVLII